MTYQPPVVSIEALAQTLWFCTARAEGLPALPKDWLALSFDLRRAFVEKATEVVTAMRVAGWGRAE